MAYICLGDRLKKKKTKIIQKGITTLKWPTTYQNQTQAREHKTDIKPNSRGDNDCFFLKGKF